MFRLITLLLCVVIAVQANVVAKEKCPEDLSDNSVCEVTEVRVNPCKNPKKCLLQKGKTASIEIDYIPHFAAEKLKTEVTFNDIQFGGLKSDACEFTPCPTVAEKPATLTYALDLSPKLPNGVFPVLWKISDEADNKRICCFKMTLKLKA